MTTKTTKTTVTQIASELGMEAADTIELLNQFGVTVTKGEDEITHTIANRFMNAVKGINEAAPALPQAPIDTPPSTKGQNETGGQKTGNQSEIDESSLTLADCKTIAQTAKVSQKTIQSMATTILKRTQSVSFQTGFTDTQNAQAHYNMGEAIANILEYNRRNKLLDEALATNKASELNAQDIALTEYGIDFNALLQAQQKAEVTRQESQTKHDPLELIRQKIKDSIAL